MATTEHCGCKFQDETWIKLCDKHEAEWQEVHTRWNPPKGQQPTPKTEDPDPWT